ncbi:MAG TPA: hypothetical protein VFH73_18150 [Polyangia bacterium]|nr:hypothetical protein [Polyangia bacterium]
MKSVCARGGCLPLSLLLILAAAITAGCGHGGAPETASHHGRPGGAGELGAEMGGSATGSVSPPAAASAAELAASVAARQSQEVAPPALVPPTIAPRVSCDARLGTDGLRRAAVNRTLDAGLGSWLRSVDVDPKLERGRFRGWIVRNLPEDVCYQGLDLQAGDVVTRINGRRVERPEEAKDIWDALRTSPTLVIDFLRDGRPRTMRFDILDR